MGKEGGDRLLDSGDRGDCTALTRSSPPVHSFRPSDSHNIGYSSTALPHRAQNQSCEPVWVELGIFPLTPPLFFEVQGSRMFTAGIAVNTAVGGRSEMTDREWHIAFSLQFQITLSSNPFPTP